jgi:hypothetical protein
MGVFVPGFGFAKYAVRSFQWQKFTKCDVFISFTKISHS